MIYVAANLALATILHILTLTDLKEPPPRREFVVYVLLMAAFGLPLLVFMVVQTRRNVRLNRVQSYRLPNVTSRPPSSLSAKCMRDEG